MRDKTCKIIAPGSSWPASQVLLWSPVLRARFFIRADLFWRHWLNDFTSSSSAVRDNNLHRDVHLRAFIANLQAALFLIVQWTCHPVFRSCSHWPWLFVASHCYLCIILLPKKAWFPPVR